MASSTLKPDFVILKLLGGTGDIMAKKAPAKKKDEPKNFTRPYGSEKVEAAPSGDAITISQVPEVNADGFNVAE